MIPNTSNRVEPERVVGSTRLILFPDFFTQDSATLQVGCEHSHACAAVLNLKNRTKYACIARYSARSLSDSAER